MHINRFELFILFSNDLAFHESISLLSIYVYICYRKYAEDESNKKYRPTMYVYAQNEKPSHSSSRAENKNKNKSK